MARLLVEHASSDETSKQDQHGLACGLGQCGPPLSGNGHGAGQIERQLGWRG
jgi:hypothetical protein